jgi:hypothetical protein
MAIPSLPYLDENINRYPTVDELFCHSCTCMISCKLRYSVETFIAAMNTNTLSAVPYSEGLVVILA